MKIDFSAPITDLTGTPLLDTPDTPLTLATVAVQSLLAPNTDDKDVSGPEKMRRFQLAQAIFLNAASTVTVEDVALIKTLIARQFVTLVVGRAYELLEG